MNTYDIDITNKQKELNTIKQIIQNNKYDTSILNEVQRSREKQEKEQNINKTKWASFTYVGKETRYITKLFKNTNVKVAYSTNNNLGKHLPKQTTQKRNRYDCSGVYQLECLTCNKRYVGQTGRPFLIRFREQYNDYKYANNRSKFAQHVIEDGQSFGPMTGVMKVIHVANKGRTLDTLERFYIYIEKRNAITNLMTISPYNQIPSLAP